MPSTMPDNFKQFFEKEPFWALVIVVLMVVPILGVVAWIILGALRNKRPPDTNS